MTASTVAHNAEIAGPDLARMRRDRFSKLVAGMEEHGFDALVLSGTGNVNYATGATSMASDAGRAFQEAAIAVVTRDGPHLFTPYPEGAPPDLPPDHLHGAWYPEFSEGVRIMAGDLTDLLGRGALRIGVDQLSAAAHAQLADLLHRGF